MTTQVLLGEFLEMVKVLSLGTLEQSHVQQLRLLSHSFFQCGAWSCRTRL